MNSKVVVDTNVLIVANGRNTHVDLTCQLACIEEIENIFVTHTIALDKSGKIFDEYKDRLNFSGAPGLGDIFFKELYNRLYDPQFVNQVMVTPSEDASKSFEELPSNSFDVSDRKFLAVAVVAEADVLNATDSDWAINHALTDSLGVNVKQLCPCFSCK